MFSCLDAYLFPCEFLSVVPFSLNDSCYDFHQVFSPMMGSLLFPARYPLLIHLHFPRNSVFVCCHTALAFKYFFEPLFYVTILFHLKLRQFVHLSETSCPLYYNLCYNNSFRSFIYVAFIIFYGFQNRVYFILLSVWYLLMPLHFPTTSCMLYCYPSFQTIRWNLVPRNRCYPHLLVCIPVPGSFLFPARYRLWT